MNDKEFELMKLVKWKYRTGGPNNSDFLQNWFPPEIRSLTLICGNAKSLRRLLLNQAECIEIERMTKKLAP